jgi:dihydrodipicolinate synthase/N-acetylneuraminate lyase
MGNIGGSVIPLPTPFDERGEVDEEVFRRVIDFEIDGGADGVMACGSYGMGLVMRPDQRKQVAAAALDQVKGRVPVIIHVGAADVQTVLELAEHSGKIGVDGLLIVPPFYYTDHNEYEITEHYKAVAKKVSLPIYIYNNKRYAGIDITPDYARRLVEAVPTIRGVKLAWGTLQESTSYIEALRGHDFGVFPGTPTDTVAGVGIGVRGTIAPLASVFPEVCVETWRAATAKSDKALAIQEKLRKINGVVADLIKKVGRTAYKELYRMRGIQMKMYPRWPAKQLNDAERDELRGKLAEAGWPPER